MAEKLFYSMGEVAEMFDVNPSLLRHWESQFSILRPKRNKKGNRLFSPQDVENLKLIYHLVKECGMTLDGAKKALRRQRAEGNTVSRDAELMERLQHIRSLLVEVREDLKMSTEEADDPADIAPVATLSKPRKSRKTVIKIDSADSQTATTDVEVEPVAEQPSEESSVSSSETTTTTPVTKTSRRPRRKKEEVENKELFAFFEQSLF